MCFRRLLRTQIERNIPTICLLIIRTNSGLFLFTLWSKPSSGKASKFSSVLSWSRQLWSCSINGWSSPSLSLSDPLSDSCSVERAASDGLNLDTEGGSLWHLNLDLSEKFLFKVSRMICSHTETGRLSSAPNMFPALSGTISWNLKDDPNFHGKEILF